MPIRMTEDPNQSRDDNFDDGGGRRPNFPGGGGGGLLQLLPLLLSLFRGKGIIFLLVIVVAGYFFMRQGGCNIQQLVQQFSQSGYNFSPEEFNKASVYEGLEDDNTRNPLPEAVSLLRYAPVRADQGQQGSCVAWSSAYAAQTILTSAATGQDPNTIRFSPSYLYNQIKLEGCQGSYLQRAMEAMSNTGGVPLREYPYDEQDCNREPTSSDIAKGQQNRIHGFQRLTNGDNINSISVRAVKEHLAKDAPVVIGMMVGGSFMQDMMGQEVWHPQGMDRSQMGFGGHAMCVIGYDDSKEGGAFQIMNSWGSKWGNNGIGWVRYGDFKGFVKEAYGIDPLPKRSNVANVPLECTIGMVSNEGGQNISLRSMGSNLFQTVSPIKKGTRFKMAIENVTECYIYVFGKETDGSSYVLFPYLKPGQAVSKHSPYCGITGYRLFPKGDSYEADTIGNKDFIAIIISKEQLDYNAVNAAINNSRANSFEGKINEAMQSMLIRSVRFSNTQDGSIYFKVDANDNKAVACIVAFDKL